MEREKNFKNYLAAVRREQHVPLSAVCDGLCQESEVSRFCSGERGEEKMMQERFLARLGVAPDNYENFLDDLEYTHWYNRQSIRQSIQRQEYENAERILNHYYKSYNMKNKLDFQFYLSMKAQLARQKGASEEELLALFSQAAELTIRDKENPALDTLLLSIHEVYLLVEYMHYARPQKLPERYEALLNYVEHSKWDEYSRAKLYPKIVYYLYCYFKETYETLPEQVCLRLLALCQKAIGLLRNTKRIYYIFEMLCIQQELLKMRADKLTLDGELQKAKSLDGQRRQTDKWLQMFGEIHEEVGCPKRMTSDCYIYEEKGMYNISQVIHRRRKMLGLSRKELAEDVCDVKTIARLENGKCKTQREIVQQLFLRLGLSGEYYRTEIITSDPEAIHLMDALRVSTNLHEYDKADALRAALSERISIENPINRQVLEYNRIMNEYNQGLLSDKVYYEALLTILEITLPHKTVFDTCEKYMTHMEIGCISLLSSYRNPDIELREKCMEILGKLYMQYESNNVVGAFISIYEYGMKYIASDLGNHGEYEESNALSLKVIRELLENHRTTALNHYFYNMWWNGCQQQESVPVMYDERCTDDYIHRCIMLSEFHKDERRAQAYKRKLDN